MSRTFAQIECGITHSKKIRALSHGHRWAYLCTHLSLHCGYLGLFRYPKSVWSDDAQLSLDELDEAIIELCKVGLIEHDKQEGFVRIVGWFFKKNAPENASRMSSLAGDFSSLDAPDSLLLTSSAEFAVGSIRRAQSWKKDSSEWVKLREVFKPFLSVMRQNFEDDFHEQLSKMLVGQKRAVAAELFSIMPSLEFYMQTPCPHPAGTVGAHVDETRQDQHRNEKKRDLEKTGASFEQIASLETEAFGSMDGVAEKRQNRRGPTIEAIAAAKRIGAID